MSEPPAGPGPLPETPRHLPSGSWAQVARRTARDFRADNLIDLAAALTYYGVLSIFPGLVVVISVLCLLGRSTTDQVKKTIGNAAPGEVGQILTDAIGRAQGNSVTASIAGILGLLAAFWSASSYVAAFMRASTTIYDVSERRPIWKTLPIRIAITAAVGVMLLLSALIVVFTGRLATIAGRVLGVGSTAMTVWNIVKWPVLFVFVVAFLAILYWASPNVRRGGFRWVSPGGVVAVVIWLIVSGLFAVYLANFDAYNETYGSLAGAVIFLVWLWATNIAILLGAEVDAELQRQRAIAAGHPPGKEPYLQPRDDRRRRRRGRA